MVTGSQVPKEEKKIQMTACPSPTQPRDTPIGSPPETELFVPTSCNKQKNFHTNIHSRSLSSKNRSQKVIDTQMLDTLNRNTLKCLINPQIIAPTLTSFSINVTSTWLFMHLFKHSIFITSSSICHAGEKKENK